MKKGDRVICIKKGIWKGVTTKTPAIGPVFNEILIIRAINGDYLLFEEYPPEIDQAGYYSKYFKKLVSDEELLEYRKNVSSKENLRPELIPIKHLIES